VQKIEGALQHYAWGHPTAIAEIRGVSPSGEPEAEYWLGAHPRNPSVVIDERPGPSLTLDRLIGVQPEHWLGAAVMGRFGELPFLFKVLAAQTPLSLQAHPDKEQALAGFEREEQAGIDPSAFERSYRDQNHKPELVCALARFEAKCGFRPLAATQRLLGLFDDQRVDPLRQCLAARNEDQERAPATEIDDEAAILGDTLQWLLHLSGAETEHLVDGLVAGAERLLSRDEKGAETEFLAELEWTVRINNDFPGDVGVAVALLLNHLTLEPGEALFLEAGVLHAYLSGTVVELMANSDNVLRCGLTSKHIDVAGLLQVLVLSTGVPEVQRASGPVHRFTVPVPEFALTRYSGAEVVHRCRVDGPEIVFVTSGSAMLMAGGRRVDLGPGESVAVAAADEGYDLGLVGTEATVWRVTVGR